MRTGGGDGERSFGRLKAADFGEVDLVMRRLPREALDDCAAYAGLPWRVEKVTLDHMLAMLLEAQAAAVVQSAPEELS